MLIDKELKEEKNRRKELEEELKRRREIEKVKEDNNKMYKELQYLEKKDRVSFKIKTEIHTIWKNFIAGIVVIWDMIILFLKDLF